MKSKYLLLLPALVVALWACDPTPRQFENAASAEMDHDTKMKYAQYMQAGQKIYNQYCANCHMGQGEGLGQLYPPLAGSDYLLEQKEASLCGILNGQQGEITVNGIVYDQPMPAQSQLTALELAEVYTYVSNSWGNAAGLTLVTEVEKVLRDCEK